MIKISHVILILLTYLSLCTNTIDVEEHDYLDYHHKVDEAEKLLAEEKFRDALPYYDQLLRDYDFVFLRDIKIAAQLAFYIKERELAFNYIKKGVASGWTLKDLKKDKFLKPLQEDKTWSQLEQEYEELHDLYLKRIDVPTREKANAMFKKDQKKAMGALLKIGDKSQIKYAEKKFAPHSEKQMADLIEILSDTGYPGERNIGNDYWISTVLSHHNSISKPYNKNDTLYTSIKPALEKAIKQGMMSPYEFAIIDDWYLRTVYTYDAPGYGFLNPPRRSTLSKTNELRQQTGLRTIELRNKLVEIEHKTGMNFYLPDWIDGEISVEEL